MYGRMDGRIADGYMDGKAMSPRIHKGTRHPLGTCSSDFRQLFYAAGYIRLGFIIRHEILSRFVRGRGLAHCQGDDADRGRPHPLIGGSAVASLSQVNSRLSLSFSIYEERRGHPCGGAGAGAAAVA